MNEKFQINNFNIQSLHINQFASLTNTLLLRCLYQARKVSGHLCGFQGYQFFLCFYHFILYFTFLFSLFVFASATGQYNVIWTGPGLPRFRFGSGTVPALLFQIKSIIQQIVYVTSGHMAVYGPVRHHKNIIWTSEASVFFW